MMLLFLPSGPVDAHSALLFLKYTREHWGYLSLSGCVFTSCLVNYAFEQFDLEQCCMLYELHRRSESVLNPYVSRVSSLSAALSFS